MAEKINIPEEVINKIKYLYEEEKLSDRKISEIVGYSRCVVYKAIIRNGFKREIEPKYANITKDILLELYVNKELSIEKIGKQLNTPHHVISKKLKEFNIPVRVRNNRGVPVDKIIELFNSGMTLVNIAKELNISESYASTVLKHYNININTKKFNINKEEFISLKNQGYSIKDIAKYYGCATTLIVEKSIEFHLTSNKTKVDLEKLKLLHSQGKNIKEMSIELNCGRKTVERQLKYLGLSIKNKLEHVTYRELYEKLVTQKRVIKEVADEYNVSEGTLKRKLQELNLNIMEERFKHVTEDVIRHLYFDLNMTQEEIAIELGCARDVIANKFKEFKIHKTFQVELITDEELTELYVNQNLPACVISERTGIKSSILRNKIFKLQLDKLKTEEERKACFTQSRDKALSHMRSKAEKEIEQLFPTKYINVHNVIQLELDLYYPEQRIAIEFNGDYWHSLKFFRSSGLHLAKLAMCNNRNIKLINIFERDWNSLKLKNKIINVIDRNLNPNKFLDVVGNIKKVHKIKQAKFEDIYNLEKHETSEYCFGTYKDKELINSVSYKIIDNKCIVQRFTTHSDYKEDYTSLFNYIKNKHGLPIIVKLDKRYYDKNLLGDLFELYKEIEPELFYVLNRKALRLEEATEEYLNNPRCYKVYDCGYSLFIY